MDFTKIAVVVTLLVILSVVLNRTSRCDRHVEGFAAKSSLSDLRGRKVAVVRQLPPAAKRDVEAVYFLVDSKGRLMQNPKLPYEGEPLPDVLQLFQEKFGSKAVRAVTSRPTDPTAKMEKVWIVYDMQSKRVTKVMVPRRWAMPPRTLALGAPRSGVVVAVDPAPGTTLRGRTLVAVTGDDGRVVSASVRG